MATPSQGTAPPTASHGDDPGERVTERRTRAEGDGASRPPAMDVIRAEGKHVHQSEAPAGKSVLAQAGKPVRPESEWGPARTESERKPVRAEKPNKLPKMGAKTGRVLKPAPAHHMVIPAGGSGQTSEGQVPSQNPRQPPVSSGKPSAPTSRVSLEGQPRQASSGNVRSGAAIAQHPASQQQDNEEVEQHLLRLQGKARGNDYYKLLCVSPNASAEELAGARRERTRQLHPDHFTRDNKLRES